MAAGPVNQPPPPLPLSSRSGSALMHGAMWAGEVNPALSPQASRRKSSPKVHQKRCIDEKRGPYHS